MDDQSARSGDIDRAKGLAILFVVFGHIVAHADPIAVHWYEPLRRAVYAFHMPFFLYLSGAVAVLSGALSKPGLITARARRLLVPFFALGIFIVFGKVFASHIMFVDNRPLTLWAGLASLIWHTATSPALSIWYLFVLFVVSVTVPILVRLDSGRFGCAMALGLLLYCTPLPAYLYLDHIGRYAVFFVLGAWAATLGGRWTRFVDAYWHWLFTLLLFVLVLIAGFGAQWPIWPELLFVGVLSMPALHGLIRHLPASYASAFLWLGRYSFMIYLFNTIFIGLAKGLLLRVTTWDGQHFLPVAIVLMISGTLGPIMLKEAIFRRIKILDRYTK